MSLSRSQFFLSGRGLVLFFLAAPKKLHHRVFLNSYPGTPYYHRTGCPAVSPGQTNLTKLILIKLKLFPPPASSRCATADCDQSLLRWPSAAFSSAAGTSPASLPREAHLSRSCLRASES